MVRFNSDDQFKFLISCIRWSNNGRIDFTEVAKECGICTKGAAAKRYERMMKAHSIGTEPPYDTGNSSQASTPKKDVPKKDTSKKETAKSPKLNKRKLGDTDEDETTKTPTKGKKVKQEVNEDVSSSEAEFASAEDVAVKKEDHTDDKTAYAEQLQYWNMKPELADDCLLAQQGMGLDGAADYEFPPMVSSHHHDSSDELGLFTAGISSDWVQAAVNGYYGPSVDESHAKMD